MVLHHFLICFLVFVLSQLRPGRMLVVAHFFSPNSIVLEKQYTGFLPQNLRGENTGIQASYFWAWYQQMQTKMCVCLTGYLYLEAAVSG